MIEKAKVSFSSVKDKLGELKENVWENERKEIIKEFKEKGENKMAELLDMMNRYSSIFQEAGYTMSSLDVSLGLPPELSVKFSCQGFIPPEKRQEIMAELGDSRMATLVMNSLFKATDFSNTIKLGNFQLKYITVKLGIIPGINISLS